MGIQSAGVTGKWYLPVPEMGVAERFSSNCTLYHHYPRSTLAKQAQRTTRA